MMSESRETHKENKLTCLFDGCRLITNNLTAILAHALQAHGVTTEDLQKQEHFEQDGNHYYGLPNGFLWMYSEPLVIPNDANADEVRKIVNDSLPPEQRMAARNFHTKEVGLIDAVKLMLPNATVVEFKSDGPIPDDELGRLLSTYGDVDAVNDGVLLDISAYDLQLAGKPVNRMTANFYASFTEASDEVLATKSGKDSLKDASPAAVKAAHNVAFQWTMQQALKTATPTEHGREDTFYSMQFTPGQTVWVVPNEVGGYTLMFPQDY